MIDQKEDPASMHVECMRKYEVTETVQGEIIGMWTPAVISQLLVVLGREPAVLRGHTITVNDPVIWPPSPYAVTKDYDYYLVRVPRRKEGAS